MSREEDAKGNNGNKDKEIVDWMRCTTRCIEQ